MHRVHGLQLFLCWNRSVQIQILAQLQVFHGEVHNGWVLFDEKIVAGEALDVENNVCRQGFDLVGLL